MTSKLIKLAIVVALVGLSHCASIERKKILVSSDKLFVDLIYDIIKNDAEVIVPKPGTTAEGLAQLAKSVGGVDAIIYNGDVGPSEELLLNAGKQFKLLASVADGYDHLNVKALAQRGVKVTNTPWVATEAVSTHAVGLALAASRRFREGQEQIMNGVWPGLYDGFFGQDIDDSIVGIVGLGRIGQATAKKISVFGVARILYHDLERKWEAERLQGVRFETFDNVISQSDFIFVHVNLTESAYHMFSDREFSLMKPTAVFVNTARGKVVDTDALIRAVKTKKVFAVGLDVMDPEPLPKDSELIGFSNVLLTPHKASALDRTRRDMVILATKNVRAFLDGKPLLTPVN